MLRCSKAELKYLSCRNEDDAVLYLRKLEVGDDHMMVHYQCHLRANDLLTEDIDTFRFNSINRKDHIYFVDYPDAMALVISTGNITTTPPANTGLADNLS